MGVRQIIAQTALRDSCSFAKMIDSLKIQQLRGDIPKKKLIKKEKKKEMYMFGSVDYGSPDDHEIVTKDLSFHPEASPLVFFDLGISQQCRTKLVSL